MKHAKNYSLRPFFSVIIPTCDRPRQLAANLFSLSRLDYARNRMEVIVVEDGGQASVQPLIDGFRHRLRLTFIHQNNAGPATARNTGAAFAKGRFLAFTDDDCRPSPGWLTCLQKRLRKNPNCAVGGKVINAMQHNAYAAFSQTMLDCLYAYHNRQAENAGFMASCNLALSRKLFFGLEGFDPSYRHPGGEDREFCYRLLMQGFKMIYAPEAKVYHFHAMNLAAFSRQHFNYGRGALHFCQTPRQQSRAIPWRFYQHLWRNSYARGRQNRRRSLFVTLLVLSQLSTAAGFLNEVKYKVCSSAAGPVRIQK